MFASVAILGTGTMGSLLVEQSVLFFPNAKIIACDHSLSKLELLKQHFSKIIIIQEAAQAAAMADCIFFAVKPQNFSSLAEQIAPAVVADTLAVSVMAGISLQTIVSSTGIQKIIRAMPNTPARVGQGVIGWVANAAVAAEEKEVVQKFFQIFGLVVPCSSEDMIDKLTALSGSGPAYVFYMMECLIAAARDLGFSDTQAQQIVSATFAGAAKLAEKEGDPALLRAQVTSKGGTTEAAIRVFDNYNLQSIWQAAVSAAYQRAKELGK